MPIIPIQLPEGMYKNGTPYTRRGRWTDGNLVRWHDDAIRPIGGWLRRTDNLGADISTLIADPTLEAVRDIFAWREAGQSINVVFGSNLKIQHLNALGTLTDITPVSANTSDKDASAIAGYGQNPFGGGAYGASNNLTGTAPIPPLRWAFDNFGEILVTLQRNDTGGNGYLYELDIGTLTLSQVTNSPTNSQDVIVTDQRQIMLIGAGGVPRKVAWCDVEDRNQWTAAINNQAGDYDVAGSGRLLRARNVLDQIAIVGENDLYSVRYIGPPYIYSFELAGQQCGAIAAEAIVGIDKFVVWWGQRNFWLFDGTLRILDCSVIDFLYADIDTSQLSKISAFTNQDFSEIWWLYQSQTTTTTEVDSYVIWNYRKNTWYTGRLDRTAGQDKGALLYSIMVDADGYIYNHELSDVKADGTIFVESGALDMKNGEQNVAVRYIYPDVENTSNVTFELIARQMPNDTEYTYGPYPLTLPTPTRAMGRSVKLKANFVEAAAELGIVRLDVAPLGTGKR